MEVVLKTTQVKIPKNIIGEGIESYKVMLIGDEEVVAKRDENKGMEVKGIDET